MKKSVVLVAEDEPTIRMLAVDTLEDGGWSVVQFATADQAMAFCRQADSIIDAVFTDVDMPGEMDGLDLAALVAGSRPKAIVIVTSGRYREAPSGLAGRIIFLPKPWSAGDLFAALNNADI